MNPLIHKESCTTAKRPTKRAQMKGEVKDADELRIR